MRPGFPHACQDRQRYQLGFRVCSQRPKRKDFLSIECKQEFAGNKGNPSLYLCRQHTVTIRVAPFPRVKSKPIKLLQRIHTGVMRILRIRVYPSNQGYQAISVDTSPGIRAVDVANQKSESQRGTEQLSRLAASLLRSFLRDLLGGLLGSLLFGGLLRRSSFSRSFLRCLPRFGLCV